MLKRRDVLAGSMLGAALASSAATPAAAAIARSRPNPGKPPAGPSFPPDREPFLNFDRAHALMEANQVDAIVCRYPTNLYYLTSWRPFWKDESYRGYPIAILTRRPQDPISMVASAQVYYYMYADARTDYPYNLYLFTAPDTARATAPGVIPAALSAHGFRDLKLAPLTPVEAGRDSGLTRAVDKRPPAPDELQALKKAFADLSLGSGRIAIDDPELEAQVVAAAPNAQVVQGENLIRRIRQVKPAHVLALSKTAAEANAAAAYAAATSTAQPGATYRELRAAFYREVALRGGTPVGMVINMVSSPLYDAEFKRGDSFFIDCVSEYQLCHGDYGRTVTIGEPRASMRRATQASQLGWTAIREKLKPGLRFSEIRAIGREALRRDGYDFDVGFTPHNVGLMHTEEPNRPDLPFYVADTVLEPGMILSVDCPVVDTGFGGTSHLEDLVVITPDGHEAINDLAHPVIMV